MSYYNDHIDSIQPLIGAFDPDNAASIGDAIKMFSSFASRPQNADVHANYCVIPEMITELETGNLPFARSLKILRTITEFLDATDGVISRPIAQKLHGTLSKNPGLESLTSISAVLSEDNTSVADKFVSKLPPNVLAAFKFAPVTSVEVERRFSRYRFMLNERRRRLTFEHLFKMFLVLCNTSIELEALD